MSNEQRSVGEAREARDIMMTDMTAEGVRQFCARYGVEREYGMTKGETVDRALEERPEAVADWLRAHGYNVEEPIA